MRTRPGRVGLFLLLLAASIVASCSTSSPARKMVATTVEPLTPRGAVSRPFQFSWRTNASDETLRRVSVYDMAERPLFERDMKTDQFEVSPDQLRRLPPDGQFQWKVAIIDDAGSVVAESGLVKATVR